MQWRGMPSTWGAVAGVGRDGRGTDSVTYSKNLKRADALSLARNEDSVAPLRTVPPYVPLPLIRLFALYLATNFKF